MAISLLVILMVTAAGCTSKPAEQQQPAADSGKAEDANLKPEYKLTMNVSNETIWGQGGNKFAELVKEYTGGKVNVKVYPNAMLTGGDQMRQAEMVQSGAIDFMVNSTINIAPTIQQFDAFSLPFLFPSYEAVDAVTSSPAGAQLLAEMEQYNMVGLAYGENGFREITNNKHPIKTPDDLKGLKIRVVTPIYIDIMRALDANAVSMNWGEVFTALQQGTIDGQENPIAGVIIPNKIYEVQKYLTNWHYSYDALVVAVNKDVWNSFPADIQDQIKKAAEDSMAWEIELSRKSIDEGIQLLKDKGVEVTDLSPEELVPFKEKTKPVFDKYAEKVGKDIVAAFEETIAKAAK